MDGPLNCYRILFFFSCQMHAFNAHCLDPYRECPHLGSQDRAPLPSPWIPTGEFFQTVPPSWVALGACLFRVPCTVCRHRPIASAAQYVQTRRTRCRLPRCCGQLVACVCTMERWTGKVG